VTGERIEVPDSWTEAQRDGLRSLLAQAPIDVEWVSDDAFTCSERDAAQVRGLLEHLADGDHRVELLVAGCGLRLAGWLLDTLVLGVLGLALRLVGMTGWPRAVAFEVLFAIDAIVLVTRCGGNVGNLIVRTQVVVMDDASRPHLGRAAIRWAVIQVPILVAAIFGAWWFAPLWWIPVYGPILFTPLRQGLHDRAAGVVVVARREVGERWSLANIANRVRR
jgi:hypothetical protein